MAAAMMGLQGSSDIDQLRAIKALWEQYPGSAPGGTGLTGLTANDAQGWSDMQNRNTWALNKMNELQGKEPYTIKFGGELGGMPPNLAQDPNWWLSNRPGAMDPNQSSASLRANMQSMPAPLRGLYASGLTKKPTTNIPGV